MFCSNFFSFCFSFPFQENNQAFLFFLTSPKGISSSPVARIKSRSCPQRLISLAIVFSEPNLMGEIMLGNVNEVLKRTEEIPFRVLRRERDIYFRQKEVKSLVEVRGGRENSSFDGSSLGREQKFRGVLVSMLGPRHRKPNLSSDPAPQTCHRSSISKPKRTTSC